MGRVKKRDMLAELYIDYDPFVVVHFALEGKEKALLDSLTFADEANERLRILGELMSVYRYANKYDDLISILEHQFTDYPLWNAHILFKLGQVCEGKKDFNRASKYYIKSIGLGVQDAWLNYYQRNNLAFCYNFRMAYKKAEVLCREAIQINPKAHNAWKNLGVSLEFQGRHFEAARCYLTAMRLNAIDQRAAMHLKRMLDRQPLLRNNFDSLKDYLFDKPGDPAKQWEESNENS
ncbi:MAG: hypothetical protein FJZ16_10155 [Candidatus Omnitrophica bacterium]|nr:hypothetical protein [Candidatus Omnitrophota bacterium]